MKTFILATLLTVTNAFAFDVCEMEDTFSVEAYFEAQHVKPYLVKDDSYSLAEKVLIVKTVKLQDWRADETFDESLRNFQDIRESGRSGDLAGSISYYRIEKKHIVLVNYFPGDNEYGAFYEMKNGEFLLLAAIEDSEVHCQ